ncbi:MAG: hypothetical protein IT488_04095 [Gammaproteobacteria bacterium]|nr:hypothetical protein [Gammaproteobacteria bacterium]
MRARKLIRLSGVAIVSLALLAGCGGDSDSDDETPAPEDPAASAEETILGVDLLPPDSTVTAAAVLSADNLPPGEDDASDAVTDEDIPPA